MNLSEKGAPSVDVGQRLKELRDERQMSLREVSRKSGISANALSMIERGLSSPSVSTLYRLVGALGVPITAIFQTGPQREEIVHRTAEERSRVPFPLGVWEGLGGENFAGQVQPFMLTLENRASSGAQSIVHTGQEFILCLQGSLVYQVEELEFLLEPGDSLLFAAHLHHCWRNAGGTVARAVIVLCGFEEFDRPMGAHITTGKIPTVNGF